MAKSKVLKTAAKAVKKAASGVGNRVAGASDKRLKVGAAMIGAGIGAPLGVEVAKKRHAKKTGAGVKAKGAKRKTSKKK